MLVEKFLRKSSGGKMREEPIAKSLNNTHTQKHEAS